MRQTLLMIAGLIVLTSVVYWPVHGFGLVKYDDPVYLYQNPYIQTGLTRASLHDAFFHFRFANWAPLVSISYALDANWFDLRPGPMHVENVLLHLLTGLLLWRMLLVFTGEKGLSYIAAAIFLCHPMHVESVAWISERKDVLSTPLLLGSMLAYARYSRSPTAGLRWLSYALMLALFALSLMAKTMGVTLPAVLLLMDYWPLGRWVRQRWIRLILEKIPLLALAAGASILGSLAQLKEGTAASLLELTLANRIGNALVCYVIYVAKLIVPTPLAIFYVHPGSRPATVIFAASILLIMATLFFLRISRRYPYAIIGWFWFLGTLVPVIGLVQVGAQSMADRYSYLPSIGLFLLLIWGGRDLLRSNRLAIPVAVIVVTTFALLARRQVSYWQSTEILFTHALAVTGDSPVAHVVLGQVAYDRGDIRRAVDECNAALKDGPYARADFALGNCWIADDPLRASGYFQKAVDLQPGSVEYRVGLARALQRAKQVDQARSQVQAALDLAPDDPDALEVMKNLQPAKPR